MSSSLGNKGGGSADFAPLALARLLHHRWALPALAQVAKDNGCKLVTLRMRLGAGPDSLKRALNQLAELDLVVANPGYGHPMRPEYVLGGLGAEVADPAQALWAWMKRAEVEQTGLKKWSLPTLSAVGHGARRFHEIQEILTEATPRAVTLALKDLIAVELITRRVDHGFPPTAHYATARRAQTALRHVEAIGPPLARVLAA